MIKEEKIMEEKTKYHKFCDICDTEIQIGLACCKAKCTTCGRDLCEKCIGHEDYTGGDYRTVYCKDCWKLGEEEYRERINNLENEVSDLYNEWHARARRNAEFKLGLPISRADALNISREILENAENERNEIK